MKWPGLTLVNEYMRFYPYRQVAGQVVGFVGMDGLGLEGAEKSFDDVLRGQPPGGPEPGRRSQMLVAEILRAARSRRRAAG